MSSRMPKLVIALIMLVAGFSITVAGVMDGVDSMKTPKAVLAQKKDQRQVILYYFHGNIRCQTCIQIEQWIRETVKEEFGLETQQGKLLLQVLNYEKAPNAHFLKQYSLTSPAAIVAEQAGKKEQRWANLEKIWDFAADPIQFRAYIVESVNNYLGARPVEIDKNIPEAQ